MFDCCPGQPFQQGDFSSFSWRVVPFPTTLVIHPAGGWEDHWTMESTIARSFRFLQNFMNLRRRKKSSLESSRDWLQLARRHWKTVPISCQNQALYRSLEQSIRANLKLDSEYCDEKISRSSKKGLDFSRESAGVWRCTTWFVIE